MLRYLPLLAVAELLVAGLAAAGGVDSGIWLDVPFVKQEREACGAAALSMVMQYWGRSESDSDPAEIRRRLYSPKIHGIYASDLENYLRQHRFDTFNFAGSWQDLKLHLEKGRPLIVALKPGAGSTFLHYVVVAGLDWETDTVLLNDPAQRKLLKQDRLTFEKQWAAAGKWTLLALPR